MTSANAYMSFKKVTRVPNDVMHICNGRSATANFSLGVSNDEYPALYLHANDQTYRVDISRMIDSIVGASAAADDEWEPLTAGQYDGIWGNKQVTANITWMHDHTMAHIEYHRRDRAPIRDWRVGQRIKNQLVGAEWEAIELYPAESRVVDTANSWHLWCMEWMPFGFETGERATQDQLDASKNVHHAMQRDDPYVDTSGWNEDDAMTQPVRTPVTMGPEGA
jgi:hypothetical protein